jgi:FkbM family methyltransferase
MRILPQRFNKPQFIFHPQAGVRRVLEPLLRRLESRGEIREVPLRWGMTISIRQGDDIGRSITTAGVFDLCVSEVLLRLVSPGDLAVDVGANLGYMTSLMACRAGPRGRVVAFEPHPDVYPLLERNAESWRKIRENAPIDIRAVALSSRPGTGQLLASDDFETNMGVAFLGEPGAKGLLVGLDTLDRSFAGGNIGVLKIDVEGHELEVLRGAQGLLRSQRIRDIVFEDYGDYPTPVTDHLERYGYSVLSLDNNLVRLLVRPATDHAPRRGWEGPGYVATRDAPRALARLQRRGWGVLGLGGIESWLAREASVATAFDFQPPRA